VVADTVRASNPVVGIPGIAVWLSVEDEDCPCPFQNGWLNDTFSVETDAVGELADIAARRIPTSQ
jgi:hypothetical protein